MCYKFQLQTNIILAHTNEKKVKDENMMIIYIYIYIYIYIAIVYNHTLFNILGTNV
jgi:hypothetical protein